VILASEAHLVLSRTAPWTAAQTRTLKALLDRLRGAIPSIPARAADG
jgi:hypothetical protein